MIAALLLAGASFLFSTALLGAALLWKVHR